MANYIHVPDGAPAVPKLDVTVDEHDYRTGALKLIKELRPNWKPSEVKMKVIMITVFNLFNVDELPLAINELWSRHSDGLQAI